MKYKIDNDWIVNKFHTMEKQLELVKAKNTDDLWGRAYCIGWLHALQCVQDRLEHVEGD